jgi:predicted nucleic acid-binding protein
MIVVADTTPINYLILIEEIHVLPKLFGRVIIPTAVWKELQGKRTPELVQRWIANPPGWLEIRAPSEPPKEQLFELDAGEREAIALADELGADVLMVDDMAARHEASRRPYRVMGTLRVLYDAAGKGLVDLPQAFALLQQTTFRASADLYKSLLDQDAQRKK